MQTRLPILHLALFIATFFTTLIAGALQQGINIIEEPLRIVEGFPFAFTIMTILLFHEFAHYIASHMNYTKATLPYFIPAPSFIGTFGAFIKMKSPIISRKALIDIGASGPIMGFIISLIASAIGLYLSNVVYTPEEEGFLKLGDSLLFKFLSYIIHGDIPKNYDILLHPVGFAGWIGLFITSLNLLPIGQLDGGHIAYALIGQKHRQLSIVLTAILIISGIIFWEGWIIWGVMMIVLGLNHPPVIFWERRLQKSRVIVGVLSIVIFIITFIPAPFRFT
ncbi:MAG: site-2 protease family protein [Thermodesulfovibrionales bacterium]|nr:site-2 protease family protein [Thermodesulfovibrionales bacterium]